MTRFSEHEMGRIRSNVCLLRWPPLSPWALCRLEEDTSCPIRPVVNLGCALQATDANRARLKYVLCRQLHQCLTVLSLPCSRFLYTETQHLENESREHT